jgi:hypothetical protein
LSDGGCPRLMDWDDEGDAMETTTKDDRGGGEIEDGS